MNIFYFIVLFKTRFMRDHAFERKNNFKEGDSGEGD